MIPRNARRRSLALLMVVISMSLTLGMVATLATYSVRAWERGKAERLRITARAIADSAAAYVYSHAAEWQASATKQTVSLNVDALLPPGLGGSIRLRYGGESDPRACEIWVEVARGELRAREEFVLALR